MANFRISGGATATSSGRIREWLPVLIWGAAIFTFSTSAFSSLNTASVIEPIIRWLLPGISVAAVGVIHGLVRKSAHFTEYAILFWLLIRGPMARRPYHALAVCMAYAMLDEGHQMFVPGRTSSLYDVALDSTGALFSRFLHAAFFELA